MKAILAHYKCIKRISEECWKEWEQNTTDDPPYYDICKNCYELICADERELLNDLD